MFIYELMQKLKIVSCFQACSFFDQQWLIFEPGKEKMMDVINIPTG